MHYIVVRDEKKGKKEEKKNKYQHRGVLLHNILQHSVGVFKIFEDFGSHIS